MVVTAEDIVQDKDMRMICEALLLDSTTPVALFMDLFGLNEIEVNRFRSMYYRDWEKHRIPLLRSIQNIKDAKEREIKENVFFHGWETIAAMFNQGGYIDAGKTVDKIVRTLIGRLMFIMSSPQISRNTVTLLKDLIKMLKDVRVETETASIEEWDLIFQAMTDEHSVIPGEPDQGQEQE
jgi:hypothetical protein